LAREWKPTFVLCDLDLGDMRAPDLIQALRGENASPVLAISSDRSRAALLDCVAAGCAGYLLRPYTLESFSRQLAAVKRGIEFKECAKDRIAELMAKEDQERRALLTEQANRPEHYYRQGCLHLARRRFDDAILSFTRAVTLQALYAEAYVGLAKAWKAKGRPDKYASYMQKAAQAYAALDEYHEARELFAQVLKDNPGAQNPFLEMGFKLLRRGEYEKAAKLYHQAESFAPGVNIYRELARACHFTGNPCGTARCMAEVLAGQPDRPGASGIFQRIMGDPWKPQKREETPGWGDGHFLPGRLRDLWLVVKFTWKIYHNGGPLAAGA
jgi:tetratricopeptide (TPR) repeat protein